MGDKFGGVFCCVYCCEGVVWVEDGGGDVGVLFFCVDGEEVEGYVDVGLLGVVDGVDCVWDEGGGVVGFVGEDEDVGGVGFVVVFCKFVDGGGDVVVDEGFVVGGDVVDCGFCIVGVIEGVEDFGCFVELDDGDLVGGLIGGCVGGWN